ncbi:integral membrane protein [Legionella nautarum]|uniref:Integral membrane protein n=1 Tax=Legionella nautarum TaxID=45070 RepID=A0A0W0WKF7_9GAMM|nr:ZIP family metal transporter [Legionella nautarum]KTD32814.1 integral membrane protein [Legionella nautarum]
MNPPISSIALYSLLPAFTMIIGGTVASFYQPSNKLTSATQHFAAGVVFAAVAKELLPKLGADNSPIALIVGFSLGVILMLLLKALTNKLNKQEEQSTGVSLGLVSSVGIDVFIDGILIGIAFLTGKQGGMLIAIALALEILFLGLSTSSTLGIRSVSIKTRLVLSFGLALLIPLGSVLGATLLSQLPLAITDGLLSFGVAALLYLVTEELLTEAHEHEIEETPLITASFFMGFLGILILENLAG